MNRKTLWSRIAGRQSLAVLGVMVWLGFAGQAAQAEAMNPELKTKINQYQQKLQQWSQDPVIINALKKANAEGQGAIDNAKWKALDDKDPTVKTFQDNEAGQLLTNLEKDKSLGKLFLRDSKGNLVAGSKKPAIFNIADRPAFTNAMRGKSWASAKVKADPTTQLKSVQLSSPVMSEGKIIGVLHTSVIAE